MPCSHTTCRKSNHRRECDVNDAVVHQPVCVILAHLLQVVFCRATKIVSPFRLIKFCCIFQLIEPVGYRASDTIVRGRHRSDMWCNSTILTLFRLSECSVTKPLNGNPIEMIKRRSELLSLSIFISYRIMFGDTNVEQNLFLSKNSADNTLYMRFNFPILTASTQIRCSRRWCPHRWESSAQGTTTRVNSQDVIILIWYWGLRTSQDEQYKPQLNNMVNPFCEFTRVPTLYDAVPD